MEKSYLLKWAPLALLLPCFSSCNEKLEIIAENSTDAIKRDFLEKSINEYTQNFEKRFGDIDPNHDWGFGMNVPTGSATRAQVANKNEWESVYHLQVPGWPDVWYQYVEGTGPVKHDDGWNDGNTSGRNHNSEAGASVYSNERGFVPGGDVTDEEIAYVSWWFRTHRYPSSLNVHWSDFYIQDISADNDRLPNGDVIKAESAPEYEKDNNIPGAWKRSRTQEIQTYTIDQLKVKTLETHSDNFDDYDHIYNYNSGQSNHLASKGTLSMAESYEFDDDIASLTTKRMMAFYQTSGTEDWAAHYSNDEKWRDNYVDRNIWVMVHLHFVGKSGRIYDGYYIGFDYAFQSLDAGKYQIRKPDGYYSNWIVKVSPGVPLQDEEHKAFSRRIMCEDLGNTWDLDFDDVVFDATVNLSAEQYDNFTSGPVDFTITLMAAGGTMPIWVGIDPKTSDQKKEAYEIHKLFNTTVDTPVNVANGYDAPIVNYHVTVNVTNKQYLFDEIPIYVYNNRINDYVELPCSVVGNHDTSHSSMNTSDKSKAPQKFAVPTTVLWLKETHQIEKGYTNFDAYVRNASENTEWYASNYDATHLCGMAAETPSVNKPTPGDLSDSGLPGTSSICPYGLKYDVIPFVNNRDWGCLEVYKGSNMICTDESNNISMEFANGTMARLHAVPKNGATFVGWDDAVGSFNADLKVDPEHSSDNSWKLIPVDGMKYVMAYFRGIYTVTMSTVGDAYIANAYIIQAQGKGENFVADTNNNKYYNCTLSFSCDEIDGKTFVGWYICDEIDSNGEMVNAEFLDAQPRVNAAWDVVRSGILVPFFVDNNAATYTFTIDQPEGCTITVTSDDTNFVNDNNTVTAPYGATVTYSAEVHSGYEWVSFNTGSKYQINSMKILPNCLPGNTLTAQVNKIYGATLSCTGGNVSGASYGFTRYEKNYPLVLTAEPYYGNSFEGWYVNDVKKSDNLTETIVINDCNMTIEARFVSSQQ